MIRPATVNDGFAISCIYNHYVLHTVVTFEEVPVSANEMQQRIKDIQSKYAWLVCEEDSIVTGYAYAGPWKTRAAYRHAVEISVYLDPARTGKGIGKQLYATLIKEMQVLKMHAVIGGVALPNDASIKLHEGLGFKKIGQFLEVGKKFGKWVDVGYWELILEH
jgi:L-amino acid N-acyltransferase YncA